MKKVISVVQSAFICMFLILGPSAFSAGAPSKSNITAYERGLIYGLAPLIDMLNVENYDFHLHGLNLWEDLPWKTRIEVANFYGEKVFTYLGSSKDNELRILARSLSSFLKSYEDRVHNLEFDIEKIHDLRRKEEAEVRSFIQVEMQSNPKSPMLVNYQDMLTAIERGKKSDEHLQLREQKDLEQAFHNELQKVENLKIIAGRWKREDNSDPGFLQGLTEGLQVHLLMLDNISTTRGNYHDNHRIAKIRTSMLRKVGNDFTRLLSILPAYDQQSQTKPINDIKHIAFQILALTDQTLGTLGSSVFNSDRQLEILRNLRNQLIHLNRKYTPNPSCGGIF